MGKMEMRAEEIERVGLVGVSKAEYLQLIILKFWRMTVRWMGIRSS